MKPPFAYYGGKVGMSARIAALLPAHDVYIEPYFGSGAVFFAKPPAPFEIINDLDGALVTFFRVLREQRDELERVCALTPHARAEFDAATFDEDIEPLEVARRFWVRVNQSFGKTSGRLTGWSVTTARSQSVPASILSRLGRFAAVAERLAGCSIECCDAPTLVERLATAETVVYADPPYLRSTRRGREGRVTLDYRVDNADEEHHERLAEVLRRTPAKVVLSGYPSPLYDQLYRGWEHIDVAVTAHSSNAARVTRGSRVERLWMNFDPSEGRLALEATS